MPETHQGISTGGQGMTTPGGVPNLPVGALTVETLADRTQDMSTGAMKDRAVERFPSIMDGSTGLNPGSGFGPFSILTDLFAGFNSTVANADPNDVEGPDDLPGLLIDFIESLPVIGKFVELFDAILGDYEGDDDILEAISDIFAPIRKLLQLVAGIGSGDGFPGLDDIPDILPAVFTGIQDLINGIVGGTSNPLSSLISDLLGTKSTASTAGSNASTALANVTTVVQNFVNTWTGGSGATGTPAEIITTTAAIKAAIANGYSVAYFSSSDPTWLVPAATTQLVGCVINGGNKGANGAATNAATAAGGAGGANGGYLSAALSMSGITPGSTTLNVTVGAAAAVAGGTGGVSSIYLGGTPLLAGSANANGIASAQGLIGTTSVPGSGGNGGTGRDATTSDSGAAGQDSGVASGGPGGTGGAAGAGTGTAGTAGGAGISSSIPLCGGGGGGGGAGKGTGSIIQAVTGGTGGNGGFPGGGSGGGGGAANSGGGTRNAGPSGTPGNGLVAILYK